MEKTSMDAQPAGFTPRFPFDLATAKAKDFDHLVGQFEEWIRREPPTDPLPLTTDWHNIDPPMAEQLLRRNPPRANRKAQFATVVYYADQMQRQDWVPTGQPILFDENGVLVDAQHRLWAILLSGATIRTFVVTNVPAHPMLFAYIDNSKPRNAAAALQTAGFNGVSPLINALVKIGESVKQGLFTATEAARLPRMAPVDVLRLMPEYPKAQQAARLASSDWSNASTYLGDRKDVVAYVGMKIIELYDEETADEFFDDILDSSTNSDNADHPITALRKVIDKDREKPDPMKRHQLLATLIKVFNAWKKGEPLRRRWMLQINEEFPSFDVPTPHAQAAE